MLRPRIFTMSLFELILMLFFSVVIFSNAAAGAPQEKKLLNDLLANYNVLERPVDKPENPVTIYLSVTLMYIASLGAKTGVLQTRLWVTTEWNDFNLKWNPQNYGNISRLIISPNRIWMPDVLIYNSVDAKFDPTFKTDVVLRQDGNVTYIPPGIFNTVCKMDATYYPFDEQKCEIKFGSWTRTGSELDLKILNGSETADVSSFVVNPEWYLVGMPVRRNVVYYSCCPEPYVDLTYKLHFRRNGEGLFSQAQLFNALIGITFVLSFLTPLKSGHRLTLAISSLAMNYWILSAVQASLPPNNNSILAFYFSTLFLINFVGLVVNVITVFLFYTAASMPNWVFLARTILLDSIPSSFLQYICPSKKDSKSPGSVALVESGTGENAVENQTKAEDQRADVSPWRYLACILDRCFLVVFALTLLIFHVAYFPTKASMTSTWA